VSPPVPRPVADVLARYDAPMRARLLELRAAIFAAAAETEGVGPLTETLKWGEPAYLTEVSKSGSTIRLGTTRSPPQACAILFNCQTTLVETFRTHFADVFAFEGNRGLIVPVTGPLPAEPLMLCLRAALTYHRRSAQDRRLPVQKKLTGK
jgi:hypothetical protein